VTLHIPTRGLPLRNGGTKTHTKYNYNSNISSTNNSHNMGNKDSGGRSSNVVNYKRERKAQTTKKNRTIPTSVWDNNNNNDNNAR